MGRPGFGFSGRSLFQYFPPLAGIVFLGMVLLTTVVFLGVTTLIFFVVYITHCFNNANVVNLFHY